MRSRRQPVAESEVEVEIIDEQPTLEQRQAFDQFWKLVIHRTIAEAKQDGKIEADKHIHPEP